MTTGPDLPAFSAARGPGGPDAAHAAPRPRLHDGRIGRSAQPAPAGGQLELYSAAGESVPDASAGLGSAASIPLVRAVAVFGSSRAAEGSHTYREAYALGRALADAGLVVVNGGYSGVMAAVARGAKEAGGRTLGITVALFPGRVPNPWLDEVVHAPTLFARLEEFTRRADAFVALCGGIGTLLELSLVWNLSQTGALGAKPVVLLGQHWTPLLRALRRHTSISDEDIALFRRAHTATDVVRLLRGPSAAAVGGRDTPSPGGAG